MDTNARMHLTEHAFGKLREILENGDHKYLLSLSRSDLVRTLVQELYFLGLHSAEDTEARTFIHALVEENIDNWREALVKFVHSIATAR
jgi:hypothetical protein